ncbi:MAG: alpha/beta fold hydrolase [Elusimicrobia bacterium]|nr:alpha/beta fold hydrolase [Elusimicrobiota bacterium]
MKNFTFPAIAVAAAVCLPVFARPDSGQESILDRVSRVEKDLRLEIPPVPCLCDGPGLKQSTISVGDCDLYAEEEGGGMPMVLLHGGPGATHHYFHPHFSRAKGFARVIYYDQRGCGESGYCPGKGYSLDQAVADLEKLRLALKIERWVVLGHSYGGLLAQYYALKHPDAFAGLVLVGAGHGMHIAMKPTRQGDYISNAESARLLAIRDEIKGLVKSDRIRTERLEQLGVYNRFLNGDWKRQSFYRPSPERVAQTALYEWKHDRNFNSIMSRESDKIDLQGAFAGFPVPTLIMEGRWDLTWNTDKPRILLNNHPGARLVMFKKSSHEPFADEPGKFFSELKAFLEKLPSPGPVGLSAWKDSLTGWENSPVHLAWLRSPEYVLNTTGWGRRSNEEVAAAYSPKWLGKLGSADLLKVGLALYDVARYEEALAAFRRLQTKESGEGAARALIWQGFLLDLQGRREQAIAVYKKVSAMKASRRWSHDQFGLRFSPSEYALEKIGEPFKRVENSLGE